jgi:hypothetical protein
MVQATDKGRKSQQDISQLETVRAYVGHYIFQAMGHVPRV